MNQEDYDLVHALLFASDRVEKKVTGQLSAICGLSFGEYRLLRALQGMHEATATRVALAQAVRLTPSGVTRALSPLEKRGYIETSRDPHDARRSRTTLTEQGGRLLDEATGVVDTSIGQLGLADTFTASERALLRRALTTLAHHHR